jgi:hypothetical protein
MVAALRQAFSRSPPCSHSPLPFAVVACGVKHCRNHNSLLWLDYLVDYSVRKAFRVTPANVLACVPTAMQHRVMGEFVQDVEEFFDKAIAETVAAAVVPGSDLCNVSFCFRS